jgi:hypothetical protein
VDQATEIDVKVNNVYGSNMNICWKLIEVRDALLNLCENDRCIG